MTPAEASRRLQEFVLDPEGAYPVIRRAIEEHLGHRISMLVTQTPKPETAYALLMAEHKMYLEWTKLLTPEGFVQAFAPREDSAP